MTERLRKVSRQVIGRLPKQVRAKLNDYWQSKTAIPAFGIEAKPAPVFVLDSNFGQANTDGALLRQVGVCEENGTLFRFERVVFSSSPTQVLEQVIAHELAHAYVAALGALPQFPPECLKEVMADCTDYPVNLVPEEATVRCLTALWGFAERMEWWFVALADYPSDPVGYFRRHLAKIEEARQEFVTRCKLTG